MLIFKNIEKSYLVLSQKFTNADTIISVELLLRLREFRIIQFQEKVITHKITKKKRIIKQQKRKLKQKLKIQMTKSQKKVIELQILVKTYSFLYRIIMIYLYNFEMIVQISFHQLIQIFLKVEMQKRALYLITGNKKKLEEFVQILGNQFELQTEDVDLPQLQGPAEEVAIHKANLAFQKSKKAVLVEDTSLCYNAYKGLPGPYIKWFLKSVGPEGLAKMVQPFEDKTGYAMCIIAYMSAELKQPKLFIGKTPGKIVQPRGSRDFGWDPVFQPDGYDMTYAELPKQEKNKISHRFRAIDEMRKYFNAPQQKEADKKQQQQIEPKNKQQGK